MEETTRTDVINLKAALGNFTKDQDNIRRVLEELSHAVTELVQMKHQSVTNNDEIKRLRDTTSELSKVTTELKADNQSSSVHDLAVRVDKLEATEREDMVGVHDRLCQLENKQPLNEQTTKWVERGIYILIYAATIHYLQ